MLLLSVLLLLISWRASLFATIVTTFAVIRVIVTVINKERCQSVIVRYSR